MPMWGWHSSHESAKGKYSFFPARFKDFLALDTRECQWASLRSASVGPRGPVRSRAAHPQGAARVPVDGSGGPSSGRAGRTSATPRPSPAPKRSTFNRAARGRAGSGSRSRDTGGGLVAGTLISSGGARTSSTVPPGGDSASARSRQRSSASVGVLRARQPKRGPLARPTSRSRASGRIGGAAGRIGGQSRARRKPSFAAIPRNRSALIIVLAAIALVLLLLVLLDGGGNSSTAEWPGQARPRVGPCGDAGGGELDRGGRAPGHHDPGHDPDHGRGAWLTTAAAGAAAATHAKHKASGKQAHHRSGSRKASAGSPPSTQPGASGSGSSGVSSSHRSTPVYSPPPPPPPPSTGYAGAAVRSNPSSQLRRAHKHRRNKG